MSFYLSPRGRCLECPCEETFFYQPESNYQDSKPQALTDTCVCQHRYTAHRLSYPADSQNPNHAFIKGSNLARNCGAFIAPIHPRWTPRTDCTPCLAPWFHHARPDEVAYTVPAPQAALPIPPTLRALPAPPLSRPSRQVVSAPSAATGHAHLPLPPTHPSRTSGTPLPPPSDIYRAVLPTPPPAVEFHIPGPMGGFQPPQPDRGTILVARSRSAHDNLPQHTTRRPGHAARGMPRTRGGQGRGGSRGRSSSGPASTTAQSSSSSTQHNPFLPNQPATKKKQKALKRSFLFCLLPFCHGDGEEPDAGSPPYQFHTMDQTQPLIQALALNDLTFTLDFIIGDTTVLWSAINDEVLALVSQNNFVLAPHPQSRDGPSHTFPFAQWTACAPRSPNREQNRKLTPVSWYEYNYTESGLYDTFKSIPHPTDGSICLVFLKPLFKNIYGPLTSFHTNKLILKPGPPHRCFPYRVWVPLPFQTFFEGEDDESCFEDCPVDPVDVDMEPSGFPSMESAHNNVLVRTRSTPSPDLSQQPPLMRRRLASLAASDEDMFPDTILPPQPAGTTLEVSRAPPLVVDIAPLPDWLRATGSELQAWAETIVGRIDDTLPPVFIQGRSVEAIATTLSSLIQSNQVGTDSLLVVEQDVVCIPTPDLGFFMLGRTYVIFHDITDRAHGAQGEGPERTIHSAAIRLRTADTARWEESGVFLRVTFVQDPIPARTQAAYVDGRHAAIHILRLHAGPIPISPFLIFAATQGQRSAFSELTLSLINTFDPERAKILYPWFQISHSDTSDDQAHPVAILLAHFLPDLAPRWFSQPRTAEAQRHVHERLLEVFLLGATDVWTRMEFLGFQDGLALPLGPPSDDFTPATTMADFWHNPKTVLRHLVALYDRQVKGPDDLMPYLRVNLQPNPLADVYRQLFVWRLCRWLNGRGYPPALRGVHVSDEEYHRHCDSPSLRAARLLYSLSESWALPTSPSTTLVLDLRSSAVSDDDRGVYWHSCTRSADIYLTPWMKNMLLEPGNLEELDTVYRFDVWMSRITCLKGGDYNRI
ncbi:hypothetical protein C8R46DRAFT_1221528 [Mycena filopes]|nr:hypothetical protein C8R46DRAFT_1221528 [Mycena filopes]